MTDAANNRHFTPRHGLSFLTILRSVIIADLPALFEAFPITVDFLNCNFIKDRIIQSYCGI